MLQSRDCKRQQNHSSLEAFSESDDFLNELQRVMNADYGVDLYGQNLKEAGENVNSFLRTFLS